MLAAQDRRLLFASGDAQSQEAHGPGAEHLRGTAARHASTARSSPRTPTPTSARRRSRDFASSLGPLGPPTEFTQVRQSLRGGMTFRAFRIRCGGQTLSLSTYMLPDGKVEQYQVAGQ